MKKILSLVLVALMLVALLPTNFFSINAEAITTNEVKSKMDLFIEKYPKGNENPWNQCYDFINELTKEVFNHGLPTQHDSKYKFKDNYKDNFIQIGKTLTVSQKNLTEETLADLLSQALPGDVIQMHYTTYKKEQSYHVMSVYSASKNGIVLYHAGRLKDRNGDGIKERGKIYLGAGTGSDKLNGYSEKEMLWSDFIKLLKGSKNGISLYRSKKVKSQTYSPELLPFSSVSTYYSNYDMTVNIFGRDGCFNSKNALDNIVKEGIDKQEKIKVQFIDCDKKQKSQVKEILNNYKSSNITFCYDTSYGATNTMFDFANKAGFGSSISLPLIVFRKSDGTIFKITEGTLEADYLLQLAKGDLSGEELVDLEISGQENYTYAYKVLNQLNGLRKKLGLSTLKMDKKLLDAAMQRSAELSIYYSHTRPNGQSAFTVLGSASGTHGENIALGQTSPSSVMSSWTNSSGHYANMTNSNYKSVGIGCFKTSDGYLCWVQLFSSSYSDETTKSGTITKKHKIEAQRRNLSLSFSTEKDIHNLAKGKYTKIIVWNLNKGFPYIKQNIDGSNFKFHSSNTKVLTISNNGNSTIKGNGKTTITVTHKNDSKIKLVTDYRVGHTYSNSCDKSCNYCGASRTIKHTYKTTTKKATTSKNGSIVKKCTVCGKTSKTTIKYVKTIKLSATCYTYNGKVKTPKVYVKDSSGKALKKNTDYTLTVSKYRKNVGTYKVTIKMKGKYAGTKTLAFKINPVKTSVSKLTAGDNRFTVNIAKKSTQVSGYQVQYSTSKKFKNAKTKAISSYKTTKYTLKSLSNKKTYYVRVRTYKTVGGKKYYSGWSRYKSVKTK